MRIAAEGVVEEEEVRVYRSIEHALAPTYWLLRPDISGYLRLCGFGGAPKPNSRFGVIAETPQAMPTMASTRLFELGF
jgi:hypothetical protein